MRSKPLMPMPMALFPSQCRSHYEEKIYFGVAVDHQIEDGAKADANTTATDTDPADAGNIVDAVDTNVVATTDTDGTDDASMNIAAAADTIFHCSHIPIQPVSHCPLPLLLEAHTDVFFRSGSRR